MSDYNFTHDWFSWAPPVWEQIFKQMDCKKDFLEIGSYEGRSTVWLVENALDEGGRITCIDTWEGGEEHVNGEMNGAKERFDSNVALLKEKFPERSVCPWKSTSTAALARIIEEGPDFDFIYIDGSHIAKDVITDACMAFNVLKVGGVMVFDDYNWGEPIPETHKPKMAIDAFLNIFQEQIHVINKSYQVAIQRMK